MRPRRHILRAVERSALAAIIVSAVEASNPVIRF